MRLSCRAVVSALWLVALPTQLLAISLDDYVDPNSQWEEAFVTGQFVANNTAYNAEIANQAQSQAAIDSGGTLPLSDFQNSFDLTINANYRRVLSTLPLVWSVEASATGTVSRGNQRGDSSTDNIASQAIANYDNYLERNPNQFWFTGLEYRDDSPGSDPFANVQAGVGYGRVINATSLAKALRLVEELSRYNLITFYPSDVVLLHLAQSINREEEYRARLGDDGYREAWFDEIEETLIGAGLIGGKGLGALGVIKVDEVLVRENINTREHGFVARVGIGYVVSDPVGNAGDQAINLTMRYAKPFGNRGQLIEDARFSRSLEQHDSGVFRNQLTYTFELSDTVDWVNNWQHTAIDGVRDDTLASGFVYDISNTFEINIALSVSRSDADAVAGLKGRLSTALRYRLR